MLLVDFAAQRADGADLATHFCQFAAIEGSMPDGGPNRVEIAVCSIPALLAMKGHTSNIVRSRKMLTTSTTASETTQVAQTRSRGVPTSH